jgi:hypothetical protein
VSLSNSKFERLDVGLVSETDADPVILDGIGVRPLVRSGVNDGFFAKRPKLSLMCS